MLNEIVAIMFEPNFNTGHALFKEGRYAEAVSHFRGLAQLYINAMSWLAWCHQHGLGVPQDLYTARLWYRMAMERDYGARLKGGWAENELRKLEQMELHARKENCVEFEDFVCGRVIVKHGDGGLSVLFKDTCIECKRSLELPYDFVTSDIIAKHNQRERARNDSVSPLCINDGLVRDYSRFHFRLERGGGDNYSSRKEGDCYTLIVPQKVNLNQIVARETVIRYGMKFMRLAAEEYIPKRLAALSQKSGLKYNNCRITGNRRSYGLFYVETQDIELSFHLMKCSDKFIDAVLMHELCHSLYSGHGADFYNALLQYAGKELYDIDCRPHEDYPYDF